MRGLEDKSYDNLWQSHGEWKARAEQAEAERDEARAEVERLWRVLQRIAGDGCGLVRRTTDGGWGPTCDDTAESDDDRCWSCIARRALSAESREEKPTLTFEPREDS